MSTTKRQLEKKINDLLKELSDRQDEHQKQLSERQAEHLAREQDLMDRQAQQEEATRDLTNIINEMRDRERAAAPRRERNTREQNDIEQNTRDRNNLERINPTRGPSRESINLSVTRAVATGGIPGYFGERALLPQEQDLKNVFISLGINSASADELFRNQISSISKLIRMKDKELDGVPISINKNKSPLCPNPGHVFISAQFRQGLGVFIEWVRYQGIIGGDASASAYLRDPNAQEHTLARLEELELSEKADKGSDLDLPLNLTSMKQFIPWEDRVKSYLRGIIGCAQTPLLYVLRDPTLAAVTDLERNGTVGDRPEDKYKSWLDYGIRCTVLEGAHFRIDNARVWRILSLWVASGPGQTYMVSRTHDARTDFFNMTRIAYESSNKYQVVNNKHAWMQTTTYKGDDKFYSFEKHVKAWFDAEQVLKRYDSYPERFVTMFLQSITDPRLSHTKELLCDPEHEDHKDFTRCCDRLSRSLGITKLSHTRNAQDRKSRRISSTNTSQNSGNTQQGSNGSGGKRRRHGGSQAGTYTGTIEKKYYEPKIYKTFSKKQRIQHNKLMHPRAEGTSPTTTQNQKANGAGNSYGQHARQQDTQQNSNSSN